MVVLVGERLVRQWLEALGGPEFRGIGRQKAQVAAHGDVDVRTHRPPRPVEHQQDVFALVGSYRLGTPIDLSMAGAWAFGGPVEAAP